MILLCLSRQSFVWAAGIINDNRYERAGSAPWLVPFQKKKKWWWLMSLNFLVPRIWVKPVCSAKNLPAGHWMQPSPNFSQPPFALAMNTPLSSTLQIYWQLLKDIYCPSVSPSRRTACNLPVPSLDHLPKARASLFFSRHLLLSLPGRLVRVWETETERERERDRGKYK